MKFAACGETMIPAISEITVLDELVNSLVWERELCHTSLRKIESFLQQIADKAEEGNEATQDGRDNVEIDNGESWHID